MPRTRKAASPLCYIYSSPAMIRSLVKLEVRFPPHSRRCALTVNHPNPAVTAGHKTAQFMVTSTVTD